MLDRRRLLSKAVIRLTLDGAKVVGEERIDMQRRIRDVIQARDGALLVITDQKDGELLRLTPARPAPLTKAPHRDGDTLVAVRDSLRTIPDKTTEHTRSTKDQDGRPSCPSCASRVKSARDSARVNTTSVRLNVDIVSQCVDTTLRFGFRKEAGMQRRRVCAVVGVPFSLLSVVSVFAQGPPPPQVKIETVYPATRPT